MISFLYICSLLFSHADIELALNWKAEPEFGGFYQAELEGYYSATGQIVKVLEGGAGTPTIQMVASGKYPFGIVSGDEFLVSQNNNAPVIALFAVFQKAPYAIITHKERNFNSIEDVFKNDGELMAGNGQPFVEFLKKKYAPYKTQIVPYLGGTSAFEKNPKISQQGFITSEPILLDKAKVKHKSFLVADAGFNPYTVVLVVNKNYLQKNPEIVKNLVLATRKGWDKYLASPHKTNTYMSQKNPAMSLETMNKSAEIQKNLIKPSQNFVIGSMTVARWQELAEQLKKLGLLNKTLEIQNLFLTF